MAAAPLVEGQTLLHGGRYRFLRRIGSGTFAVILCAMDQQSRRLVAIKCVQSGEFRAVAEREASVLRHVNARDPAGTCAVVRLLDVFEDGERFCLVLELLGDAVLDVALWGSWRRPLQHASRSPQHKLHSRVGRISLSPASAERARAIDPAPALSLQQIRLVAVHLCAALAFLHDQGLIHADIKPENVVRTGADATLASGTTQSPTLDQGAVGSSPFGGSAPVKLIDFGNCVDLSELSVYRSEYPQQWAAEAAVGFDIQTLTYRAPEVAAGVAITPAIDMWSLGCVLMECATGTPLFTTAGGSGSSSPSGLSEHASTNRLLLRQIEVVVNGGELLDSTCKAYQSAICYVTSSRDSSSSDDGQKLVPTLQQRLDSLALNHETPAFHDFIRQLLDVNPETRLQAKKALFHPFLQGFFPFQLMFSPVERAKTSPSRTHKSPKKSKTKKQAKSPTSPFVFDTKEVVQENEELPVNEKPKRRKLDPQEEHLRRRGLRQALKLIPSMSTKQSPSKSHRKHQQHKD